MLSFDSLPRPSMISAENKLTCATPICALAAISCCSACRMSGRRSSKDEGSPAGTSSGWGWPPAFSPEQCLRIFAEQNADEVLLLLNPLFKVRDGCSGGKDELLSLADIEQRGCAVIGKNLGQPERVFSRRKRLARDFQFQIQLAQLEICAGHVAHQRTDNRALCPLLCQQAGPSRLRGPPVSSPEVQFPCRRETQLVAVVSMLGILADCGMRSFTADAFAATEGN